MHVPRSYIQTSGRSYSRVLVIGEPTRVIRKRKRSGEGICRSGHQVNAGDDILICHEGSPLQHRMRQRHDGWCLVNAISRCRPKNGTGKLHQQVAIKSRLASNTGGARVTWRYIRSLNIVSLGHEGARLGACLYYYAELLTREQQRRGEGCCTPARNSGDNPSPSYSIPFNAQSVVLAVGRLAVTTA